MKKRIFSSKDLIGLVCFVSLIWFLVSVYIMFPYPEVYIAPKYEDLNHENGLVKKDVIKKELHSRFGFRPTEKLTIDNGKGESKYTCSFYFQSLCYIDNFKHALSRDIYDVNVIVGWSEHSGRRVVYNLTINGESKIDYKTSVIEYNNEYLSRKMKFKDNLKQSIVSFLILIITFIYGMKNEHKY